MICEHCHKENRSIAKFCKWCGQPLVSQNVLDRMIGLDDVKKQLKTVVDTYTYLHSRKDVMNVRLSVNAIIIGETGTGKTALAEVIRDYFYQHKIIDKPKLTMVDAFLNAVSPELAVITNYRQFGESYRYLLSRKIPVVYTNRDKLFLHLATDGAHWICEYVPIKK